MFWLLVVVGVGHYLLLGEVLLSGTVNSLSDLMAQIPRNYSDRFLQGGSDVDLLLNKNVDWMNRPFFALSYVAMVLLVSFVLKITQLFEPEDIWTIVNVLHCVVCQCCL